MVITLSFYPERLCSKSLLRLVEVMSSRAIYLYGEESSEELVGYEIRLLSDKMCRHILHFDFDIKKQRKKPANFRQEKKKMKKEMNLPSQDKRTLKGKHKKKYAREIWNSTFGTLIGIISYLAHIYYLWTIKL